MEIGQKIGWRFLLTWVVVGSVTLVFGLAAGIPALFGVAETGIISETAALLIGSILFGLFVGSGLGLGQAVALRPTSVPARRWFVFSGLGAAVLLGAGLFLIFEYGWDIPEAMAGIIIGLLLGISTATGQWWLLRKSVLQAGWWLLLGALIPTLVVGLALPLTGEDRQVVALIGIPLSLTVLTGLAMRALLRGQFPQFHPAWLLGLLLPFLVLAGMGAAGVGAVDYGLPPEPIDPNQHIIYHNGTVLTMDETNPIGEAIAIEGAKISAVGTNEEILALERPDSVVVDLRGLTLMPGFIDPHSHLLNDAETSFGMNMAEVQELGLRNGITAIGDLFVNESFLNEMREFEAAGHLRIRTSLYLVATDNCGRSQGDWWQAYAPERPSGGMLHVTGIKVFTDGGTCGRVALSYELRPGEGLGELFLEQDELNAYVMAGQEAGFQVAIHAIGDRAVDQAQNAIEAALAGQPNTFRHRIEHNSVIRPEQLPRYGQIGIVFVGHGLYPICNPFGPPPPPEYYSWDWPTRALLEANPGLPIAWHSDDPFQGRVRPLDDLYSFVTRDELTTGGTICEAPDWQQQHTITAEQALQMMTVNSAYALWRDKEIGRLTPGYYADLIVLTHNPLAVETSDLKYIDVRLTMVGGRVEYCALGQGWLCP